MASSTYKRRPKRRGVQYDGRTFGGKQQGPAKPKVPGKRHEAAESALTEILELFESGELPAKIAQTEIAGRENLSPMVNWSLGNQLIALLNGTGDARGYRQWQDAGRHVSKGAKAIYILGPLTRKITERDAETGEERTRPIVTGFVGIPVFRIEDTEGSPIVPPDYDPPAFPPLYDVAERLGVSVRYLPFVDRFRGYYRPGEESIVLCSHDVSVFFHELAHAAHKRVLRARGVDLRGGQVPSQEIVAETCAATLCHLYGHDGYLYHGADYIAAYANGGNPAKAAMRVLGDVQATLKMILDHADETAPVQEAGALAAAA